MGSFVVYKSSAGSGKTHTLMIEYLSLALKYVSAYPRILAITFTNKAANEIKQRILESLEKIALADPDETLNTDNTKESDLFTRLSANTGLTRSELIINAGKVLTSILHHYSDFAVSTIDSFMHRVIRSFAFDLKLSMSFEVELDTNSLINTAVDELISKTGKDTELTDLLKNYVIRQAENDENWDISEDLRKTAAALFKEKMNALIPALDKHTFNEEDFGKVCSDTAVLKNQIKSKAAEAINLFNSLGFAPEDFIYGNSGVGSFFNKAADGRYADYGKRVINAAEKGEWFKKNSPFAADFAPHQDAVVAIINSIRTWQRKVKFLELIRDNFHSTLLMKKINDELNFIRQQRSIVPISDFNTLISNVVKEQPVPFIYLRAGEKFRHFMIDEFQDTSEMQWENFLPLIENSLSDSQFSMIVGDGKQAIYRFKNGDAEQFVMLPKLKYGDQNAFTKGRENLLSSHYEERFLDRNFRSREEIVNFNNHFFAFAAPHFTPAYAHFYPEKEVKQKHREEYAGGLVKFDFVDPDNIVSRVLTLVDANVNDGYSPGDIAIITRVNKDAVVIASALQQKGIKVVSSESLLLSAADEISFLLNWIRWMADGHDKISMQGIIQYLLIHKIGKISIENTRMPDWDYLADLLKELSIEINPRYFESMSFYDSIEYLIRTFNLYQANPVYVSFFLDEVLRFTQKKSTGAVGFLEHWEICSEKLSINIPIDKDAVQIMTVHKSKGLDFPVVIYAFPDQARDIYDLDWDLVTIDGKEMPMVYRYSAKLEDTPLEEAYNAEKARMTLDKFNLYYVAFTRPSERLFVVLEEVKKDNYPPSRLNEMVKYYLDSTGLPSTFGDGSMVKGWFRDKVKQASNVNISTIYDSVDWHSRLIIAKRSPSAWETVLSSSNTAINFGKLVHRILSEANSLSEINTAIGEEAGSADPDLRQYLFNMARNIASLPESSMFFGSGTIIREQEILTPSGEYYRPDRVVIHNDISCVIDFKTGIPNEKHHQQVLGYMELMYQMGYPNPVGYIIYIAEEVSVVKVIKSEVKEFIV